MPHFLTIQQTPLSHINFSNHEFFLLPFLEEASSNLISSIKRNGILHPPIIQESQDGGAVIISGRKRLSVAKEHLKLTSCECLVAPKIFTQREGLALALEESLLTPPLSCIQKAIFLQKITTVINQKEAAKLFLPLWDQAPQLYYVKQYLQLATLEEPLSKYVHAGMIAEKTALLLSNLSFRDRFALFEIITSLRLSISNQRKIVKLCCDLAKRYETSVHKIVTTQEITEILQNNLDSPQQTTDLLMSHLNKQHSPGLTEAKKQFTNFRNRLKLPKWASINHSPAFEQNSLILNLTLENQQELENCWQEICKLKKKETAEE